MNALFWQTWWLWLRRFGRLNFVVAVAGYRLRINYVTKRLNLQFENRLTERIQVARDLHDTLLQTIQASKLVADDALSGQADQHRQRDTLEKLSGWLGQAIQEGRLALSSLRNSTTQQNDLVEAFRRAGEECRMERAIEFDLVVEVDRAAQLHPIVRDEVYLIGLEAIRNSACTHAEANRLTCVELSYEQNLVLRVRDDGMGIPPDYRFGWQGGTLRSAGNARAGREASRQTYVFKPRRLREPWSSLWSPEKIAFPVGKIKGLGLLAERTPKLLRLATASTDLALRSVSQQRREKNRAGDRDVQSTEE